MSDGDDDDFDDEEWDDDCCPRCGSVGRAVRRSRASRSGWWAFCGATLGLFLPFLVFGPSFREHYAACGWCGKDLGPWEEDGV